MPLLPSNSSSAGDAVGGGSETLQPPCWVILCGDVYSNPLTPRKDSYLRLPTFCATALAVQLLQKNRVVALPPMVVPLRHGSEPLTILIYSDGGNGAIPPLKKALTEGQEVT